MLDALALAGVLLAGLYFVGLAAAALAAPARAARFLLGFAGSASAHCTELALRLAVGCAFILRSPRMPFELAFAIFGWVIVATTAALFLVPWQWHRHFAQWAVPHALRHLRLVGLASLVLGGFVLACAGIGNAA
jgi:uncharacterized protein YjeT (DUF2065 family)